MKIIREAKMYGTSLGIRFGIDLIDQLDLKAGDVVEAEITKVERLGESEFFAVCGNCTTPIIVRKKEEIIICPVCKKEGLKVEELQKIIVEKKEGSDVLSESDK